MSNRVCGFRIEMQGSWPRSLSHPRSHDRLILRVPKAMDNLCSFSKSRSSWWSMMMLDTAFRSGQQWT
jgi:hypothetical protein